MNTKDCIDFFGSKTALAVALGIAPPSIYSWGEFPPKLRQLQIERLSGEKLKAEADYLTPKRKTVAA